MTSSHAARALRSLGRELQEAHDQAKLAYQFGPSSYTFSTLSACLAAEAALGVLPASLSILEAEHD
jgi:hypothetical protein